MRPTLTAAAIGLCCLHASYSDAVEFDGLGTSREIPASVSAALGDGSQASLSVWATLAAEGTGKRQEIVVLTIKDSFVKFIVGFAEDDTIRVGARTRADEDSQGVRTVRAWPAGQELHIAATVDVALGEIRIFVNGERQETTGTPSWVATDFSRDVGGRNTIGVTPYRQHYFHGALRDLRLYNRVLLEAEVRALYEDRPDAVSAIGLLGTWLTEEAEAAMTEALARRGPDWPPMVGMLSGSPREIGTAFGQMHGEAIRLSQAAWLQRAADNGFGPDELLELVAPMVEVVRAIAPHWLEEGAAVAEAAGVDADLYNAQLFYIGPATAGGRGWFRPDAPDDCTSYTISRDVTEANAVFFHRTRDNTPGRQSGLIWETRLPGIHKFMGVNYTSTRAISVMVNDQGLVGSADQGGPAATLRKDVGMMNGIMKRYIAETASTCEEALAIVTRFVDQGWYAGGRIGTRWTFADRHGAILDISHSSDPGSLTYQWVTGRSHITRTWGGSADRMLEELPEPVAFTAFRNVSRHPDAQIHRGPASIAGMTVRIHPEFPQYLTSAWFSFPAISLAFPLYIGGTGTPLPLLDGSVYDLCADLPDDRASWETLERTLHQNALLLEARAEALLREGHVEEAQALIDSWTQSVTAAHLLFLEKSRP